MRHYCFYESFSSVFLFFLFFPIRQDLVLRNIKTDNRSGIFLILADKMHRRSAEFQEKYTVTVQNLR